MMKHVTACRSEAGKVSFPKFMDRNVVEGVAFKHNDEHDKLICNLFLVHVRDIGRQDVTTLLSEASRMAACDHLNRNFAYGNVSVSAAAKLPAFCVSIDSWDHGRCKEAKRTLSSSEADRIPPWALLVYLRQDKKAALVAEDGARLLLTKSILSCVQWEPDGRGFMGGTARTLHVEWTPLRLPCTPTPYSGPQLRLPDQANYRSAFLAFYNDRDTVRGDTATTWLMSTGYKDERYNALSRRQNEHGEVGSVFLGGKRNPHHNGNPVATAVDGLWECFGRPWRKECNSKFVRAFMSHLEAAVQNEPPAAGGRRNSTTLTDPGTIYSGELSHLNGYPGGRAVFPGIAPFVEDSMFARQENDTGGPAQAEGAGRPTRSIRSSMLWTATSWHSQDGGAGKVRPSQHVTIFLPIDLLYAVLTSLTPAEESPHFRMDLARVDIVQAYNTYLLGLLDRSPAPEEKKRTARKFLEEGLDVSTTDTRNDINEPGKHLFEVLEAGLRALAKPEHKAAPEWRRPPTPVAAAVASSQCEGPESNPAFLLRLGAYMVEQPTLLKAIQADLTPPTPGVMQMYTPIACTTGQFRPATPMWHWSCVQSTSDSSPLDDGSTAASPPADESASASDPR